MNRFRLLVLIFFSKISLDFLVPSREVSYLATTGLCAGVAIVLWRNIRLSAASALALIFFGFLCIFWYAESQSIKDFVRYSSLPVIYLATRAASDGLSSAKIARASYWGFIALTACFLSNYVISLIVASPLDRQFFGFEHANILGSYILFGASLLLISSTRIAKRWMKPALVAMAALSTSTGAAILSLSTLVPAKGLGAKRIATTALLALVCGLLTTLVIRSHFEDLYTKIYGPFLLVWNEGFGPIADLARKGAPIQELGDQYQSSLTWRFYAYVIYFDFIMNMPASQLLFGRGFGGYGAVWGGIMPHNDYILALVSFGIVPFSVGLLALKRTYSKMARVSLSWRVYAIAIAVRLFVENNISSFYLLSFGIMCLALLQSSMQSLENREIEG